MSPPARRPPPTFLGLGKGGVGGATGSGAAGTPTGGPPNDAFVLLRDYAAKGRTRRSVLGSSRFDCHLHPGDADRVGLLPPHPAPETARTDEPPTELAEPGGRVFWWWWFGVAPRLRRPRAPGRGRGSHGRRRRTWFPRPGTPNGVPRPGGAGRTTRQTTRRRARAAGCAGTGPTTRHRSRQAPTRVSLSGHDTRPAADPTPAGLRVRVDPP
jgi:hypothetical protein